MYGIQLLIIKPGGTLNGRYVILSYYVCAQIGLNYLIHEFGMKEQKIIRRSESVNFFTVAIRQT